MRKRKGDKSLDATATSKMTSQGHSGMNKTPGKKGLEESLEKIEKSILMNGKSIARAIETSSK